MTQRRSLLLAAGAAAVGSRVWAQGQKPAPLPIKTFFSHDVLVDARLSPDGRQVALRVGAADSRDRLAVLDLATMKVDQAAGFDDADVADCTWISDKRLVFTAELDKEPFGDRNYAWGLFAVNSDGSSFRQIADRHGNRVRDGNASQFLSWNTFLLGQPGAQTDDTVLVVQPEGTSTGGGSFARLLRVHTVTRHTTELDVPAGSTDWLVDFAGQPRIALSYRDDRGTRHMRQADGRWRTLREFERYVGDWMEPRWIGPDGTIYAIARAGRDNFAVHTYDPAADRLSERPLLAVARYDIHPQFIANESKLLGLRFNADAEVTVWLDEDMKALQAEVDRKLPATGNMITPPRRGTSPFVLVRSFADVQPTQYHVFDRRNAKLTPLGGQRPGVPAARMSEMNAVSYRARDGLDIPAYLTLPRSGPKEKLPLVVLVHGGPWVRGGHWKWKPEVQFLASRGYAVLEPDYRGSTGYGHRHFRASFGQWGQAMQDDLTDGARWAVAQGIADPKRIAIMGASYGGYATLMGLIREPELFRCGVCWVGVTDLLLMYDARWSDFTREWKRYGMTRLIGNRERDADMLRANSPLHQAARLKNPLLLAHGKLDRRVPIEHGERLRDALKGHNPSVEWIEYEKEGHGWSIPATDIDFWSRVERFLGRHLAA